MTKPKAVRTWEAALKRREQLATEVEGLKEQLEGLEAEERRVLERREGLQAVQAARETANAARAMLETATAELQDIDARIPELEAASDRADHLTDMAIVANLATSAGEEVHSLIRGLLERESAVLEQLVEAHERLDSAVARYDELGRAAVPGTISELNLTSRWQGKAEERKKLEAEIRRGGTSLKAVLSDIEPEQEDPLYKLVWGVYWTVRNRHRAKLQREKEEAIRAAELEKRRQLEERRYGTGNPWGIHF